MIRTERHDAVLLVTMDRPERRNAVDRQALDGLAAALEEARSMAARVLVLTGAGGHFCAGADLADVEDEDFVPTLNGVLRGLREAPFPTVAAIDGFALGAGTQLALACDLRMATADAALGVPAARLGLMVDQWTVRRLVALSGQSVARDLLLTADRLSGERAHGVGLVSRLGSLDDAMAWAGRIATLAPLTLVGFKVALNEADEDVPPTPGFVEAFDRAWSSDDFAKGLRAFAEKRSADFEGR